MKKTAILSLAGILLSGLLMAQSFGSIKGKITDPDGHPVPFASATAYQGENPISAMADEEGRFVIKPLASGIYNFEVRCIGYHPYQLKDLTIEPDQIRFLNDITLQPNTVLIEGGATVEEFVDPLIDPEETSKMTMRSAQIEKTPLAKNPVGLIASMSSDISQKPGTNELYFRGARPTSVLYMIDGQKVRTGAANFPGGAIGSISVYTGGIPAKYGDTTGGVVVIETKNYFDFYREKQAELNR